MSLTKLLMAAAARSGGSPSTDEPTGIGEPFQGGYYVGKMNYGVEGEDYWLVVAEKSSTVTRSWKTTSSSDSVNSLFDGAANTAAKSGASFPAMNYCSNYVKDGYDDWYLPARDELELCYRNLKPSTSLNFTGNRLGGGKQGENTNSIPVGLAYTTIDPPQTPAFEFRDGGAQFFESDAYYWCSSQSPVDVNAGLTQIMGTGIQGDSPKLTSLLVRPVRRVKIPPITPPTEFGQEFQGGFYAGKMKYSDGEYWLVVAPKSTEASGLQWKTSQATDAGALSVYDGAVNTISINDESHPAAKYCSDLTINGYKDWYLPARDELELCYRNLKPSTGANKVGARAAHVGTGNFGDNNNSIPVGSSYTSNTPAQTLSTLFQFGNSEHFSSDYFWTSSEALTLAGYAMAQKFLDGEQNSYPKTNTASAKIRAVRRVKIPIPDTGPGSKTLQYGDQAQGFYGEVLSTEFMLGSLIATGIGLGSGTVQNDSTPWLKFSLDGRILFIPKLPIRHSISWNSIYQAGAVYGDGTTGLHPTGAPKAQTAQIVINGYTFKVRLLRGVSSDPFPYSGNSGDNLPITADSEWDRLMYAICSTATPTQPSPKWNVYTDAELGITVGNGRQTWCQEKATDSVDRRACRGWNLGSLSNYDVSSSQTDKGWRPCLELIS